MKGDAAENEASYFIFRLDNTSKSWAILTYVPDGVNVKEKMTYASAKNHLKDKLGHGFFTEEIHTTTTEELSYSSYKGNQKPIDSRSTSEKEFEQVLKQEDEARTEMAKQQEQKSTTGATTGGYHSVNIPLSDGAKAELAKIKDGSASFVQLAVNETKDKINAEPAKNISNASQLQKEINTNEPRFYIYKFMRSPTAPNPTYVFLYCCPEKSPAKLRMVYSTAKPALAESITKLGIPLAGKRVEITEPNEVTDDYLRSEVTSASASPRVKSAIMNGPGPAHKGSSSPATPLGGTTKASNPNVMRKEHPIYSLMTQGKDGVEKPSTKKKIVMPPPGAWN